MSLKERILVEAEKISWPIADVRVSRAGARTVISLRAFDGGRMWRFTTEFSSYVMRQATPEDLTRIMHSKFRTARREGEI